MATNKKNELKQLSKEESAKRSEELHKELMRLRTQSASGAQMESPGRIRALKRALARLKTFQHSKEGGKDIQ